MNATLLPGSATLFSVEGETLCCDQPGCNHTTRPGLRRKPGAICPSCGRGNLKWREYQVDVAAFDAVGQCGCEQWEIRLGPKIRAMTSGERNHHTMIEQYRCKHVKAARAAYAIPSNLTQLLRALTQEAEGGP